MNCDGCTVCCDLFPVKWLGKPAYTPCVHCINAACSIHDDKPPECKSFECSYFKAPNAPLSLRPDHCGVVFENISPRVFYGLNVPGQKITEAAEGQMEAFLRQGFSVALKVPGNRIKIMLAEGHKPIEIEQDLKNHLNGNIRD